MERLFLIIIIAVLLLSGCSDAGIYFKVTRGNFSFGQGEYEKANIDYLHVLEKEKHADIVNYNLGKVYYALGEPAAAQEEWTKAENSDNEALLFDIYFNLGVLQYDLGEYGKAYSNFKQALMINPHEIDAKKNLELCLQKMQGKGITGSEVIKNDTGDLLESEDDEIRRILEFVRRKEEGWLNTPGEQSSSSNVQDW